jgi:adenylosuccinate synthase
VGSGPFPTELFDETGKQIRDIGNEYGSTTGRERRCGWLDLPALKYAVFINGVTQLIMMKSDVLNSFEKIKIAVAYEKNGKVIDYIPFETDVELTPIYKEFEGWKNNSTTTKFEELPAELINYITYIEKELQIPIKIISYGPDRTQTLFR